MKTIIHLSLSIIYFLIFTESGFTQTPDVIWTKNFGGVNLDYGNSIVQSEDGGFLIAGFRDFISGQLNTGDVWLLKTNSNGDTLWSRTYGDTSGRDEGISIQPVSGGGYIIAGKTTSYGAGESDAYLIMINNDGDTIWTKTYGGENDDFIHCVQQTSDNGFIFVGGTYSFGIGGIDIWLIRTDFNGDTIWTKTYGTVSTDYGNSVKETSDGGFVLTGRTMDFSMGSPAIYLVRTDSNGDILWEKIYNHPNAPGIFSIGEDVHEMPDGGFLIGGSNAVLLIRTDANGDSLWTKLYSGNCSSMQQTTDGGFIIAGNNRLIRTNNEADTIWTKTIGESSDQAYAVQQTSDGGFIVTGRTNSSGNPDVWIVRISSDGTLSAENNSHTLIQHQLFQNYPNPFNPTTKIRYSIPHSTDYYSVPQNVTLKVYDVLGNEVSTLVDEYKQAGTYEVEFNANNLTSGIYFYQLNSGDIIQTKKFTLIK